MLFCASTSRDDGRRRSGGRRPWRSAPRIRSPSPGSRRCPAGGRICPPRGRGSSPRPRQESPSRLVRRPRRRSAPPNRPREVRVHRSRAEPHARRHPKAWPDLDPRVERIAVHHFEHARGDHAGHARNGRRRRPDGRPGGAVPPGFERGHAEQGQRDQEPNDRGAGSSRRGIFPNRPEHIPILPARAIERKPQLASV